MSAFERNSATNGARPVSRDPVGRAMNAQAEPANQNNATETPKRRAGRTMSRRALIVLIGVAALVAAAGVALALVYADPGRQWFARVNGVPISRAVLVDVLRANQIDAALTGAPFDAQAQTFETAARLVDDETLRQAAPRIGVAVSGAEVAAELAAQLAPGLDAASAEETLRQYAGARRLSAALVESLAEGELLRREAAQALGREIPDPQPQARVHSLVLPDPAAADLVRADAEQGVPFEEIARRYSLDPSAADLGWLPYGALPPAAADAVRRLPIGELSPPFLREDGATVIYVVSARAAARPLDAVGRELLQDAAFDAWLRDARAAQEIELRLDSSLLEWTAAQLAQTRLPPLGS